MFKNVAGQQIAVFAWDTVAQEPKTGDVGNITAYISKDGGPPAQSDDVNPSEIDSGNLPGVYVFDILQAESNCDLLILSAMSSTPNITLEPVIIYTQTVMRGTDIGNLQDLSQAEAEAACDAALTTYDAPTRAEATSDKDEIIVEVDANETKIDALNDPTAAAIADAVLEELIADHVSVSGSLAEFIELIKDIAESDELLNTDDATQWLVQSFKKGTSTEIMRKNLFDNTGASVIATSQVVGARTHTASP